MKATVAEDIDFPRAPDAFALAEAAVEHVVRADVTFGPVTFAASRRRSRGL